MTSILFVCSGAKHLASSVINQTGLRSGLYRLGFFADGEISFYLDEPVKGNKCYVLGSTGAPGDNLLEMLTIVNTLKINKAKQIIAVIPYLGYSRSDRQKPLQPINARLFPRLLAQAGVDRFVTLDLHSNLVERYIPKKNIHLTTTNLFADEITKLKLRNFTIASPDLGGAKRASKIAKLLGLKGITLVEKHRPKDDTTEVTRISGESLEGKDVVFIDDMIMTGRTLTNAAKAVKKAGALRCFALATHCVYPAKGIKLLSNSSTFSKIIITNSLSKLYNLSSKVTIKDISSLIANAILSA